MTNRSEITQPLPRGELTALLAADRTALSSAIHAAVDGDGTARGGAATTVPIRRVGGRRPVIAEVLPITGARRSLLAPAVVIDLTAEAEDPSFLLEQRHVEAWIAQHGPLPQGSWLLYRTGWSRHGNDPDKFLNNGVTPGVHPLCAQWLAEQTQVQGIGVETVGTDAGQAGGFDPAYPCHWFFHGANKYGLTQLRNLHLLPARGAMLVVAPLPIVGGSGSPCRVMAIFDQPTGA